MPKYQVWEAYAEPFNKNKIDDPDFTVDAADPTAAAIKFAEKEMRHNDVACYVREVGTDAWFEIELIEQWEADMFHKTTLEEITKPKPEPKAS